MHREGAELAFTYPNERMKGRVEKIAAEFGSEIILECEAGSDDSINACFTDLSKSWDGLDIVVHSIGFAPKEELDGSIVDNTTREGSQIAHDISAYSFLAMAKAAKPLMAGRNGSGIKGFRQMLDQFANAAPLGRNVTIEEVGNAAAFLSSDLASGITAEIMYVDGGYSTVGMTGISAPEES